MGIVSTQYRPLQNLKAFQWFNFLLHEGSASLEAAGALKGGKRIWVLARVNEDELEVKDGDTVKPYLLLSNSHDGTSSVWIQSELPSKINMASAQGNQLSISLLKDTSIRQFVSDRLNQTSLITIKSVGQKGAAMAILEGKAIGWLDARSKTFLSAKNLLSSGGKDFSFTLTTANPLKAIAYIQERPIGILSTESKRKLEQKQLILSRATYLPKMQLNTNSP